MIRTANVSDAYQLFILNEQFNGKGETDLEQVQKSLAKNNQEIVVVAEENDTLTGFVCVQIKHSFCYSDAYAEITEVFTAKEFRRKGFARSMITFAENYCADTYHIHNFEILTGKRNIKAQKLYKSLGYSVKNEMFLSKKI